jgi:hypothetical protein
MQEPVEYFIVKDNKMWDEWLQKLFAQAISVKVWVMAILVILLWFGKIDGGHFTAMLTTIMGLKGAFALVDVWKGGVTTEIMKKV